MSQLLATCVKYVILLPAALPVLSAEAKGKKNPIGDPVFMAFDSSPGNILPGYMSPKVVFYDSGHLIFARPSDRRKTDAPPRLQIARDANFMRTVRRWRSTLLKERTDQRVYVISDTSDAGSIVFLFFHDQQIRGPRRWVIFEGITFADLWDTDPVRHKLYEADLEKSGQVGDILRSLGRINSRRAVLWMPDHLQIAVLKDQVHAERRTKWPAELPSPKDLARVMIEDRVYDKYVTATYRLAASKLPRIQTLFGDATVIDVTGLGRIKYRHPFPKEKAWWSGWWLSGENG